MDLIEQHFFFLACELTLPPFASLQVCDTSTEQQSTIRMKAWLCRRKTRVAGVSSEPHC